MTFVDVPLIPDPEVSPSCDALNHDACFHVANPLSRRRDWRACGCACHLPPF